jgi:S-(hydroxymethyl)glutathione synthase
MGLGFIHVELSEERVLQEPQIAAFVSSIIEQGFDPNEMDSVRLKLNAMRLDTYDVLSPQLICPLYILWQRTLEPCDSALHSTNT